MREIRKGGEKKIRRGEIIRMRIKISSRKRKKERKREFINIYIYIYSTKNATELFTSKPPQH